MTQTLALIGPTAVGKTDVSIELAKRLDAEIIGCDSMQVYRGMSRLATQPTPEQRAIVPHHLVDCIESTEPFNVGQYRELALAAIRDIHQRGRAALIVGGTGLYLKSLTDGLCEAPPVDERIREELLAAIRAEGSAHLHARLQGIDPQAASKIHPNDARRVVRALEVYELTGKPLSSFWERDSTQRLPMELIGLTRERSELYERINQRVERMLGDAAVREDARAALGLALSHTARQVHGLRYLEAYLRGDATREQTSARWKQQVRNYAKRQLIWFRADPRIRWISLGSDEPVGVIVDRILESVQVNQ